MTAGWYATRSPWPLPPKSVSAVSPYTVGQIDIRWEDPSTLHGNEGWIIRGVNIYRSTGSDRGPYSRINIHPIGGTFYRDSNKVTSVHNEVVTNWISKGEQAENPFRFYTQFPIARLGSNGEPSFSTRDVTVTVDGIIIPARSVFGPKGEVSLVMGTPPDPITYRQQPNTFIGDNSVVLVSYLSYSPSEQIRVGVDKRDIYRVTTVAEDPLTNELHETPLDQCDPFSDRDIEQIDYIWREGIRRNNWILEQGGERVRFFTRRVSGEPCSCTDFHYKTLEYGKQPDSLCKICFGTGIKGGYDGPYDLIIAPDEAEKRISQMNQGRRKEHSYEVWIGPSPLVSQRDFIVKQNNDRYSVGAVRYPSSRGNILQQHFNIAYLDSGDIRYSVPMDGAPLSWPKTNYTYWPQRDNYSARSDSPYKVGPDNALPMQTDRPDRANALEVSGRTATWENQNQN